MPCNALLGTVAVLILENLFIIRGAASFLCIMVRSAAATGSGIARRITSLPLLRESWDSKDNTESQGAERYDRSFRMDAFPFFRRFNLTKGFLSPESNVRCDQKLIVDIALHACSFA